MPALTALLPLAAPLLMLLVSGLALRSPGLRPALLLRQAEAAALAALAIALLSAAALFMAGPATSPLLGAAGIGFSVRLDVLSVVMLLLVAFLGWVVIRYAATYLDGEANQGAFTGWLAATLAAVMLMITAGNLGQLLVGWVGTTLALHKLLTFYPGRRPAALAALKANVIARASDGALVVAVAILWSAAGTGDIASILALAEVGTLTGAGWAATFLVLAAILRSAQVPLHGWLTEVMETPTPVSALLHAGIVNAGGVLILRFADVMLLAPGALVCLALLGGITALWGSLVMLTQPAIKTALAWSTVAQMGFMMLQAGLALFPLALLHIVAHSLYKAHAFLSASSAVAQVKAARAIAPATPAQPMQVLGAMGIATALYLVFAGAASSLVEVPLQAIGLGAVLALGLLPLLAPALSGAAPALRLGAISAGLAALYVALHGVSRAVAGDMLPMTPSASEGQIAALTLLIASFAAVAAAQATLPLWAGHPRARTLRAHLANGLYANALLHRAVGGFARPSA